MGETVGIACYSCRRGTTQAPCERPAGGWIYDSPHGWRCPSCAESVIESLRAEVDALRRATSAAERLVKAVDHHQGFWARVSWESERAERAVLAARHDLVRELATDA